MGRHYSRNNGFFSISLKILLLLIVSAALLFVLCRLYPDTFPATAVRTAGLIDHKAREILDKKTAVPGKEAVKVEPPADKKKQTESSKDVVIKADHSKADKIAVPHEPILRPEGKPIMAIVVDDGGDSLAIAKRLARLDLPVTWAIMPYRNFSVGTAELAAAAGIPYLLHLPMQAESDKDGGPYLIGRGMGGDEVHRKTAEALDSLPAPIGVNNHRGSLATSKMELMIPVMDELRSRGLIFLDSRTSSKSVAYAAARNAGVPAFMNRGFLDGVQSRGAIESRFNEAVRHAQKRGSMIVICHFRPETVSFLEWLNSGQHNLPVRLVTLPEMSEIMTKLKKEKE